MKIKLVVFDIGGTEIKYSVMNEDQEVFTSGCVPTPTDSMESLLELLHSIYEANKEGTEGIAISMPGMIDSDRGICHTGGMLGYNQGQPFAKLLGDRCGCPVHIDNDGKCAAIAEHTTGSLKGCQNGAVFLIGTGVGGGLIINGKLLRGKHFSAGEFSFLCHNIAQWDQLTSLVGHSCATTGFLELLREAKNIPSDQPFNGINAFQLVNEGDREAISVLKKFTHTIAFQIYNLQMLLDLERIAIGGGISKQDILLKSIQESFTDLLATAYPPLRALVSQTVEIVRCKYENDANQIGAMQSYLQWRNSQD